MSLACSFDAARSGMSVHHANLSNWSCSNFWLSRRTRRSTAVCLLAENKCLQGTEEALIEGDASEGRVLLSVNLRCVNIR